MDNELTPSEEKMLRRRFAIIEAAIIEQNQFYKPRRGDLSLKEYLKLVDKARARYVKHIAKLTSSACNKAQGQIRSEIISARVKQHQKPKEKRKGGRR
jgi:hypothetical protein